MVCVVATILTLSLILPPLSPGLQGVRRDHRPGLPDVEEGDEDDEEAEEEEQRQTLPAEESRAAIRVLVEPPESEGRAASPPPPPPPPVVTVEAPRVVSGKRIPFTVTWILEAQKFLRNPKTSPNRMLRHPPGSIITINVHALKTLIFHLHKNVDFGHILCSLGDVTPTPPPPPGGRFPKPTVGLSL